MTTYTANVVGQETLRAEHFEHIVKGFALQEFVMKQLVMVDGSNFWIETYYQEQSNELTASLNRNVAGVPRMGVFPGGLEQWTKIQTFMQKYGMEGVVSWEDATTNNIPVIARTLLRIARAVSFAVDYNIWQTLSNSQSIVAPTSGSGAPQLYSISTGNEWNASTVANQNPMQDILNSISKLQIKNFNPMNGNGYLVLSPTDAANLLGNATIRNAGFFGSDAVSTNGKIGRIAGLNVVVSNVVTSRDQSNAAGGAAAACSYAMVVVAKECGTWKSSQPLTVQTITDPGISYKIRAWEIGVCQLTTPNAVVLISNTSAS